MVTFKEYLELLKRDSAELLRRFITADETWNHNYTPETKQQSKQWLGAGESAPKEMKKVPSAEKVTTTVFWNSRGALFNHRRKGRTITDDNVSAHTHLGLLQNSMTHFTELPHAPYSPDLAPSDNFLFPNLKIRFAGRRFTSNDGVKAETNELCRTG